MDLLEAAEIAVSHVDMSRVEICKPSHAAILERLDRYGIQVGQTALNSWFASR